MSAISTRSASPILPQVPTHLHSQAQPPLRAVNHTGHSLPNHPSQTNSAIPTSRARKTNRKSPIPSQSPKGTPQITITSNDSLRYPNENGLGISLPHLQVHAETLPAVPPRAPCAPSQAVNDALEDKPHDLPSRLEKKIWQFNRSNNLGKRWLMEIISWLISALCTGAILIMVAVFDHRPLASWDSVISLNTFISILSKVAISAMLFPVAESLGQLKWGWFRDGSRKLWDFEIFDNASRGPWGSFLLIIRTRW